MKIKLTIDDITHGDLVNLFCTGTYGSNWLSVRYDPTVYKSLSTAKEDDCLEDKWARLILGGHTLGFCDHYAEDEEFYGELPHKYDNGCMVYTVGMDDIINGIVRCFENGGWDAKCVTDLIDEGSCEFDLSEAENIMQWIMFGEAIYG
jgi:hypothetical protein